VFREVLKRGLRKEVVTDIENIIISSISHLQSDLNHRHSTSHNSLSLPSYPPPPDSAGRHDLPRAVDTVDLEKEVKMK